MRDTRATICLTAAVAVGLLATACGSSGGTPKAAAGSSAGAVVKLGQVLPVNSVQAALAKSEAAGAEVAADEINAAGGVDGKWKIQLELKDDGLSTARVGTVMRELNDDGVKLTFGFQISPECKAAAEAGKQNGQVVLASHCATASLTDPPITPNFWMTAANNNDLAAAAGKYFSEKLPGVNTWDVFGYDSALTKSLWTLTQAAMEKARGSQIKANQTFWVPVDATNYRSQLTAQSSGLTGTKDSRGLFLATYGAGTTSYLKQAQPLGLLAKYSAVVQLGAYWSVAIAMNGTSPDVYNAYEYFAGCQQNAMNDAFVKAYEAKMHTQPDTGAYQAYMGVKFYAAAIAKAGSTDPTAVQAAFAGLSLETPTGGTLTMNGTSHHAAVPLTIAHLVGDPSAKDGVKYVGCTAMPSGG
jgi:branched-chain amino acid transport system substrate-binding protein